MRLVRDRREQLAPVKQCHARGGGSGERAVVAAAAPAEPVTGHVGGERGDENHIRGGDGAGPETVAGRLQKASGGRDEGGRAGVGSPVEVEVGQQDGQQDGGRGVGESQALHQVGAAGFRTAGLVGREHAEGVTGEKFLQGREECVGGGPELPGGQGGPCVEDLPAQRRFLCGFRRSDDKSIAYG